MFGLLAGAGAILSGVGGYVSSQYSAAADQLLASGDFTAAQSYGYASNIASQNAQVQNMASTIQQQQLNRKVYQALSTEQAQTGEANVTGGSAGDLMRMSFQQGALARTLAVTQGDLSSNAFAEQATAYRAMQSTSTAAGQAALVQANSAQSSGLFGLLGSVVGGIGKAIGSIF